ncbi:MAG TPA: hypothetical protein VIU64_01880 [Polyangia bacterium]
MSSPVDLSNRPARESAARRNLVWVLVSLAYLAVAPYFPRINNPNENVRIWMTRAIALDHTLAIDHVTAEWGNVDDKATARGHLYSSKAPGTSLAGVPVMWLQAKAWRVLGWPTPSKRAVTFALRYLTVVPSALIFLLFFGRWVERRTGSPAARDLLTVAVGLGTLLYPYGILFVGHAQAAMLGFGAFMALGWERLDDGGARREGQSWAPPGSTGLAPGRLAAAGALAGSAVVFEYQVVLLSAAVAGLAAWRARGRFGWFLLGALPPAAALGTYHTLAFGKPWAFPYGHLENPTYAHVHHGTGFFGLHPPALDALGTSLFSVSYGLFVFSPFLLVGACLLIRRALDPERAEAVALLASAVALVLFLSGMTHWRAGWCVGPRYIAAVAPVLAAGVALQWRWFSRDDRAGVWRRGLLGGLVAVSVALNGLSAATYPHYPEQFDNPVFDLALPAWRAGYVPSGLGHALGLPRLLALLPVAILWAAALGVALASPRQPRLESRSRARWWPREGAIALGLATLCLGLLASYGRHPSAAETRATDVVRSLWDPRP